MRPILASAGSQSSSDINENNNKPTTVPPTFEYLSQTTESGSAAVRGLCVAGDVLYVVRDNQLTVDVYNRQTMNRTGRIQVSDDDIHPTCMAIDKKTKICLYISYEVSKMMRKVEVQSGIVTRWPTSSEPDGVAVIPESSNVIVAFKMVHMLTEYKSTIHGATIVREFNLANDLFPRFVTPFSANKFVVCYGEPGKSKCGVALVDTSSGVHVKHFETKSTYPASAVVGADGFVFVADSSAETVALFRNVNYVSDVIPANDGVHSPNRLSFDDNCEMLYVAESTGDCRILAYKRIENALLLI